MACFALMKLISLQVKSEWGQVFFIEVSWDDVYCVCRNYRSLVIFAHSEFVVSGHHIIRREKEDSNPNRLIRVFSSIPPSCHITCTAKDRVSPWMILADMNSWCDFRKVTSVLKKHKNHVWDLRNRWHWIQSPWSRRWSSRSRSVRQDRARRSPWWCSCETLLLPRYGDDVLLIKPCSKNTTSRLRAADLNAFASVAFFAGENRPRCPPDLAFRRKPDQPYI